MIGRALRDWNSPTGVLAEVWGLVIASNVLCPSCHLMYSVDGLNAHAPGGVCGKSLVRSDEYNIHKVPVRVTCVP